MYGVEVRAIGFARGVFPGVDVGDNAVERDFALSPGVSIEGMAVDDSGAPLEGAEVVVLKTEEWDRTSSAETRSARRHRRDNASGFACARTDARGRYLLTQLPEEDVTLVARAPGHEPSELLVVRPGEPPAELTLARLVSLSGTVRDGESGRAVSLFNVILKGDRGEDSRRTMGGEEQFLPREFDEPVGAFLIEGIAPGPYLLAVGAPGYAIWSGEITIPGEGAEVKVSLERGRTLQGRVVEAETGAPIVGARIICQARGWSWFYVGGMPLGSSRDDGTFSIGGLLEGTYSVYVHSSGYAPEPESVRVVISETDPEPLRLAMRGAGRLQVTIEGYDPARSVEAFVCLKRMEGEKTRELTYGLGRDGRAEAGAVPPGVYEAELKELVADPSLDLTRAGTSFRYEDLSEKRTPLGQVEVRAGEKATLETRLP
jgi:hypothetical protein